MRINNLENAIVFNNIAGKVSIGSNDEEDVTVQTNIEEKVNVINKQ